MRCLIIIWKFPNWLILDTSWKTIAAYGAAAKGNTLLNYCGVKNDLALPIMFVKHNG